MRLRDAEMRGARHPRGLHLRACPLPDAPAALVQVAETEASSAQRATEIIICDAAVPVIPPLAVLLVCIGTRRAASLRTGERIRARKPDDLSPLDHCCRAYEVALLVDSVNDPLRRLSESMATQKRFLADAAHQLKITPLAGLRM